ncbi:MAG: acyltransferase family protein [Methylococcales bacterium]|nr:acyltransferase family protein [Methylococcales bacterium]
MGHFSSTQTTLLKGVGILLIVLHNYYHNLTPLIGENEFAYSQKTFWTFYQTLKISPENFLRAVFSYFGHYGVQIFIFFSTYGLTLKYQKQSLNIGEFFKNRVVKIYFSFLLCVAVYIVLACIKSSFLTNQKVLYWDSLLWKVLLASNFIPRQALMPVGPWWFLPFIMQVYVLYPWLLKAHGKFGVGLFVLVSGGSFLLEWLVNPYLIQQGLNINHTVFGHLSVVCLGIILALQPAIKLPIRYLMLALVVFTLANVNAIFWIAADLSFSVLFLAIAIIALKALSQKGVMTGLLLFYGTISFHLFMVNGFLRSLFHNIAETYHLSWLNDITALASLLFSTLCAYLLMLFDKRLRAVFG